MRHRLNRGGDRALNSTIHTIPMVRMRSCPTTQAYVTRRTAEGKDPPVTFLISPDEGLQATGLGMTCLPLSLMIWGVLSPWSEGANDR